MDIRTSKNTRVETRVVEQTLAQPRVNKFPQPQGFPFLFYSERDSDEESWLEAYREANRFRSKTTLLKCAQV